MKVKIRPLGNVTQDLEPLLEEMVDSHDLQCGEILALIYNWVKVHRPSAVEEYLNGENPEFYYGPKK